MTLEISIICASQGISSPTWHAFEANPDLANKSLKTACPGSRPPQRTATPKRPAKRSQVLLVINAAGSGEEFSILCFSKLSISLNSLMACVQSKRLEQRSSGKKMVGYGLLNKHLAICNSMLQRISSPIWTLGWLGQRVHHDTP